jgi:hypothetical protein
MMPSIPLCLWDLLHSRSRRRLQQRQLEEVPALMALGLVVLLVLLAEQMLVLVLPALALLPSYR